MKNAARVWALVLAAASLGPAVPQKTPSAAGGSLTLSGAWALYPLAVRWQEEFEKSHPGVNIDVQAGGAGKGVVDALAGVADVGMVSREILPAEFEKGAVAVAVAKDAVVATVSRKNPHLAEILLPDWRDGFRGWRRVWRRSAQAVPDRGTRLFRFRQL